MQKNRKLPYAPEALLFLWIFLASIGSVLAVTYYVYSGDVSAGKAELTDQYTLTGLFQPLSFAADLVLSLLWFLLLYGIYQRRGPENLLARSLLSAAAGAGAGAASHFLSLAVLPSVCARAGLPFSAEGHLIAFLPYLLECVLLFFGTFWVLELLHRLTLRVKRPLLPAILGALLFSYAAVESLAMLAFPWLHTFYSYMPHGSTVPAPPTYPAFWEHAKMNLFWWLQPGTQSHSILMLLLLVGTIIVLLLTIRGADRKRRKNMLRLRQEDAGRDLLARDHGDTLVVYANAQDLLERPQRRLAWQAFLRRNGNAVHSARTETSFLYDRGLCMNAEAAAQDPERIAADPRTHVLLYQRTLSFPTLTRRQQEKLAEALEAKAAEGYRVIVQDSAGAGLFRRTAAERRLNEQFLPDNTGRLAIPQEVIDAYDGLKETRSIVHELSAEAKRSDDPFLREKTDILLSGEDPVAQFYDLLLLAEYCIHLRALRCFSDPARTEPVPADKLRRLTLGTLADAQRIPDLRFADPDLAQSVYDMSVLASYDGKTDLKTKYVRYNDLCTTVVRIRNRFLGHGAMTYFVNGAVLVRMAKLDRALLRVFLDASANPQGSFRLNAAASGAKAMVRIERSDDLPGITEIPARITRGGRIYYFAGWDRSEGGTTFDYLDFRTGQYLCFRAGDLQHPISIPLALRGGTGPSLVVEEPTDTAETPIAAAPQADGDPQADAAQQEPASAEPLSPADAKKRNKRRINWLNGWQNAAFLEYSEVGSEIWDMLNSDWKHLANLNYLNLATYEDRYLYPIFGEKDYTQDEFIRRLHLTLLQVEPACALRLFSLAHLKKRAAELAEDGTAALPIDASVVESLTRGTVTSGFLTPDSQTRIAVIGEDLPKLQNPYPWIRSLAIDTFSDPEDLMIWALNGAKTRRPSLLENEVAPTGRREEKGTLSADWMFARKSRAYWRILDDLGADSLLRSNTVFLSGFFRNLFDFPDPQTAANGLFEFLEFSVRSTHYFLLAASKKQPEREDFSPDFQTMCERILANTAPDSPLYARVRQRTFPVPPNLRRQLEALRETLPFDFDGSEIDFPGLGRLLRTLRNSTRGHGILSARNSAVLWVILLYAAVMMGEFLDLRELFIVPKTDPAPDAYGIEGTGLIWRYGIDAKTEHMLPDNNLYFLVRDGLPCPLHGYTSGRPRYLNYFTGTFVTPEFV